MCVCGPERVRERLHTFHHSKKGVKHLLLYGPLCFHWRERKILLFCLYFWAQLFGFVGREKELSSSSWAGIHVDKLLSNLRHIEFGLKNKSSTWIWVKIIIFYFLLFFSPFFSFLFSSSFSLLYSCFFPNSLPSLFKPPLFFPSSSSLLPSFFSSFYQTGPMLQLLLENTNVIVNYELGHNSKMWNDSDFEQWSQCSESSKFFTCEFLAFLWQ